jgi:hypothetical protein
MDQSTDGAERRGALVMRAITPCSPVKVNLRFGGTYRLYLQSKVTHEHEKGSKKIPLHGVTTQKAMLSITDVSFSDCCLLHASFSLPLVFDPEDGGDRFL